MEKLPGEVLSDIFIRLLAKEVAQMRCACKSWNALLSDSSFIKSHLHHSIQNNDEILLFLSMDFSLELSKTPFTARPSCSPDLVLPDFIKLRVSLQQEYGCGSVIGSVNGLICFYYISDHEAIHIWNPSLSALLTLPPSPSPLGHLQFGFDSETYDYKVLRMVPWGEVYSMRKGSWESISQSIPSHITIFVGHDPVCVNDHLHWLGYTDLEGKLLTIMAFDLGAEEFIEIPLLDYVLDDNWFDHLIVLGVLGGKLCVMSGIEDGECEVWVMDEYGVSKAWVKHHVFPPFSGDIVPYGFTSHGEFLFQVDKDDDRIGFYDPVAAKTKTFMMMPGYSSVIRFVEYVDSLVWIQPPNWEISSCDISRLQIGK